MADESDAALFIRITPFKDTPDTLDNDLGASLPGPLVTPALALAIRYYANAAAYPLLCRPDGVGKPCLSDRPISIEEVYPAWDQPSLLP